MIDRTEAAFNELYKRTSEETLKFIAAKCGDVADIYDIYQEIYIEIYLILKRKGEDYIKNENALIKKVARQKLFRHYGLKRRLNDILPLSVRDEENGGDFDITDKALEEISAEDMALDRITLDKVAEYLRERDMTTRRIFYLYFNIGATIPEIAGLLNMGQSNVKNRLYRTLKQLRERF